MKTKAEKATFGNDIEFLKQHTPVGVLSSTSGQGQVAVLPALQGRIMTSTVGGTDGLSYGWINRKLVAAGNPCYSSLLCFKLVFCHYCKYSCQDTHYCRAEDCYDSTG